MLKPAALAGAIVATFVAGTALAADLPSHKAPPPAYYPPPPPMWTGFYLGANAGYQWVGNTSTEFYYLGAGGLAGLGNAGLLPRSLNVGGGGFIGGGQIGYNYQIYDRFVIGLEADIQGIASGGATGSAALGAPATFVQTSRGLDYLGTVRGRIGYLLTPTLLVYGTGGLAYGGVNLSATYWNPGFTPPIGTSAQMSDTLVGYTFGGGVEWMFWPNWSAKVEYLRYDLGDGVTTGGAPFVNAAGLLSTATYRAHFNGNIVRAGVNYHFNWGAPPIIAKY